MNLININTVAPPSIDLNQSLPAEPAQQDTFSDTISDVQVQTF